MRTIQKSPLSSVVLLCGLLGILACHISGCAPALPEQKPERIDQETISQASLSAARAEAAHAESQVLAERSAKLLEEARALLARAEEIERSCADTARIIAKRKQQAKKTAEGTTADPTKVEPPKDEKGNAQWSPSDGPF